MSSMFLDKARANLTVAQYCLANGFYDACANRAYYADFQAAITALEHHGFASRKNEHKWVQSSFNGMLIKRRKIYPARFKSYLLDMLNVRNDADYFDKSVSKIIASHQQAKAEEFVEAITKELSK